ncbi:SusC/RagA family TonB-linked outer membrane protein [Chitinophaga sp. S165]|uniref:SusC/RagA family TonB-linked outer membrane protein n=1 Tax=Chitinophaga sp. S165 TaxID=2135462 RepID=UPI000D71386F|nr:SusC/RagA family TonB-linked outer membrane protein [Chitinophaga sp. S165]PWV47065.1 TonB-linked SusC/RagA family outer membrane protein [Chitinophaga sp. S165]
MTTYPDYKTLILVTANYLLSYLKPTPAFSGRLFFILITSLLFFDVTVGQERVTLSGKQLSIEHVLHVIESQTGYLAWVEDGVFNKSTKVDIEVVDLEIQKLLDLIFNNQPLNYKVIGRTIVITRRKDGTTLHVIHGTVISEGRPVESASIQFKGTSKGTITGPTGEFSLTGNISDTVIIVSCVGFELRELVIRDDVTLQIELSKAAQELDEPVVIGYGTTSRRTNPGSVGTLNSMQIGIQPVTNPLLALQGRVTGLFVQQMTGMSDGEVKVRIGGQNSIQAGNEPLYIVDGVPFPSATLIQAGDGIILYGSPLANLNPQDIESISVLKDADATAIYGSRGANGVILITTKKGRPGKSKITVATAVGLGRVASQMRLLSTPEYLMMRWEAFKNDQVEPDPTVDHDLLSWDSTRNVDWQEELIGQTARIFQERLSVSGGGKLTTFSISTSYRKETTVFPGHFYIAKGFLHASLQTSTKDKKVTASFSSLGTVDKKVLPSSDPTFPALTLPPNAPAGQNADGTFNWTPGFTNPYASLNQVYKATGNNLILNGNLTYNPYKGFNVKINLGRTSTFLKEITPVPVSTLDPAFGITTSFSNFAQKKVLSWIAEPQLEYTRYVGRGKITLLSGITFQDIQTNSQFLSATGYIDPSQLETTEGAASTFVVNRGFSQYRYNGVYARVEYDLMNRYIAEVTGRRDGSSRFGPDQHFGTFGAFGIAWLLSEEPWFKKKRSKIFDFAKLKFSYGITGNDQIGDYEYLSTWSNSPYKYANRLGFVPERLYNSEYSWETNRKLNIGLETALLNHRVRLGISYYHGRCFNELIDYSLSTVTGFESVRGNFGVVILNSAVEVEINTINIKNRSFKWTTSFNLTFPSNILEAFPKLDKTIYRDQYVIGKSLNIFKAYHFTGVDKNTGIYTFEDVDKDGQITFPNDLTVNKVLSQTFFGGMQNSITYKGLRIDIFIQFNRQTGYNYLFEGSLAPGMQANQPKVVLNRWRDPGIATGVQQFTQRYGVDAYNAYSIFSHSDAKVSDASYLRLKNLSMSYDLTRSILKTKCLERVKLYLEGQNVLTINQYQGLDPENQNINNAIPPLRIVMIGVEVGF